MEAFLEMRTQQARHHAATPSATVKTTAGRPGLQLKQLAQRQPVDQFVARGSDESSG
jgi:hypothetical protein